MPADAPRSLPEDTLRGPPQPWGRWVFALAGLVLAALTLRFFQLSAEGFGDDEIHKWLAANRYLIGDFTGDDVEHPMLMKSLIALSIAAFRPWFSPETLTRIPNVLAGGASVLFTGLLGRRLFGRTAGLVAAGLAAFSTTLIGYQRIAKEDVLLGLFLLICMWALAEAKSAADDGRSPRRWEYVGAAALGAMLASKYFIFLAGAPVVFYLSVRKQSAWRVPPKRWAVLIGVAFLVFAALDWTPFMPSTWDYAHKFIATGGETVHGQYYFMGKLYRNLVPEGLHGTPPWFYAVFLAVKLSPLTALSVFAGLVLAIARRRPSHKLLLSWLFVWGVLLIPSGSKWGRFMVSAMPAFLILAAWAALQLRRAAPVFAGLLIVAELVPALQHAPHYRLYINSFGGGDKNVTWFFPHCDYFDTGMREAVEKVAARAPPGSEIDSDVDTYKTVKHATPQPEFEYTELYARRFGRPDLTSGLLRRNHACLTGMTCYVLLHEGRRYTGNEEARALLAHREPWDVVRINGIDVVRIYRLAPGESPFPPAEAPKVTGRE